MKRKPCKECPWHVESEHNKKFRGWSEKIGKHRCHMIDAKNLWKEPTEDNICVGKKGD
jgi:hypothetical protein